MAPKPISFVATGLRDGVGGIVSANQNVALALRKLASETGRELDCLALHDSVGDDRRHRGFSGRRGGFVGATLDALLGSDLVVFDHVRLALPILAIPRGLRAPAAIFAHGSESWKRMKPGSVSAFRRAKLVLTNSHYTLSRMGSRFSGFEGQACPLGLPPQILLTPTLPEKREQGPALPAADGATRPVGKRAMLLVARMDAGEQEKGHRELVAAMPAIVAAVPEAQMLFVGSGSDVAAIAELARNSAASGHIFLPGRVDGQMLERLYASAFAFVMPSRQEGFGLVHLEAMNRALPCLACRDDGAADIVVDGETGVLIDQPVRQDELAAALIDLLRDEGRARTLGEAGWRRLHAEFTSQAHQARVLDALRPLLP